MAASSSSSQHYEFDGSILEGGGQVLRQSVALAAILDKNVKIVKVRGKRTNPGLQRQHLTGIDLVTRMTRGGKLEGAVLKSAEVEFKPSGGGIACFSDPLLADSKGAGAVALLLQVSLPCAIVSPSSEPVTLVLKGGTNAAMAPQIDYAELVFVPTLRRLLHADISINTIVRGFYPRGQGEVRVQCQPLRELPCFTIVDRGEIEAITIRSFACNLDADIARRLARAAEQHLRSFYPEATFETDIRTTDKGVGPGAGIILVARTSTGCLIGGDALGEPGKEAGKVGREAAVNLVRNLERSGAVDEYLQDQLIIYATLASGTSIIRVGEITMHTETAIHFAREIAHVDIQVEKQENNTFLITIQGLGYQNKDIGLVAPLPSPGSSPHLLQSGKQGSNSRGGRGKQQRKRS